jgi:hypothetical protein
MNYLRSLLAHYARDIDNLRVESVILEPVGQAYQSRVLVGSTNFPRIQSVFRSVKKVVQRELYTSVREFVRVQMVQPLSQNHKTPENSSLTVSTYLDQRD